MFLSPIVAGTMRWGIWGANHTVSEVQHLIEVCILERIYTFDHADIYGDYTTEKLFGDAFAGMSCSREEVIFISKCGIEMPCSTKNYHLKSYNYSKDYIIKSVEQSLSNLKTDYLDILLLHRPSPLLNPYEVAEAIDELKNSGKVKDFGVSNFSVSQFNLLHNVYPLVTNQIEISLNNTKAFDDGTLDQLMQHQLNPMAYAVMGNYFTEKSLQNKRITVVLNDLCVKYNASENQLLLAFLLKHPSGIIPVIGTSKAETIKEMAKSTLIKLERQDWFKLYEAARGREVD